MGRETQPKRPVAKTEAPKAEEASKTPEQTLAEMQQAKEKLAGIRERATKAQEDGQLSPEGEMLLLQIEEKEKTLEENIAKLEENIREAEEFASQAPEEKQVSIWDKIEKSYDTAKNRINIATGTALAGSMGTMAYGAFLAANSYDALIGKMMPYEGIMTADQGVKYAFAAAGVGIAAHAINKGVQKVREWKASRADNRAYEKRRREAGLTG